MKKITVIILTAVYLLSAIGVSASSFYCCGVLRSTTLSIGEVHSNGGKATAKTNNCCKTTKQSFKINDNHYGAGSFSLLTKLFPVFIPAISPQLGDKPFAGVYTAFNSHAPPFLQNEAIYKLTCTYRI